MLRRNRKHLLTQDTVRCDDVDKPISTDDPLNQVESVPVDNQGMNADSSVQSTDDVTQIVTTRSGRMIRPPKWQKDFPLMWTIVLEKKGMLIVGFHVPMPGCNFETLGLKADFVFSVQPAQCMRAY